VKLLIRKAPLVVLHAEDELADAHLVKTAVSANQITANLFQVSDGTEVLKFLREPDMRFAGAKRPDLILLDLYMSGMDGRECLTVLKKDENLRSIPVVILSMSDAESDIVDCYALGASGYITKPVDVHQYNMKIKHLFDYWIGLVRLPTNSY